MGNTFYIKQNDRWPPLDSYLRQGDNTPIALQEEDIVEITIVHKKRPNETIIDHKSVTVLDGEQGLVRYNWDAGETAVSGDYLGEFLISIGGVSGISLRVPNEGYFNVIISPQLPKS